MLVVTLARAVTRGTVSAWSRRGVGGPRGLVAALLLPGLLLAGLLLPGVLLAGAAGAAPAGAAEHPTLAELAGLVAQRHGAARRDGGAGRRYADTQCVPDPPGDTFRLDAEGNQVPTSFPRADILEHCAALETGLVLRLRTAEPQDPRTDPRWSGADSGSATQAMWFLDAGAGFRHVAVLRHDGTAPIVEVLAIGDDGAADVRTCTGRASFAFGFLVASDLDPRTCVDGEDRIVVAPVKAYDADPSDAAAPVHFDIADDVNAVTRSGTGTPRGADRLAGAGRIATAAAISADLFEPGVGVAYLARADAFPDALAAGTLTDPGALRGPILLVPSCGPLPEEVNGELTRLDPPRVVALGGSAAVCDDLLDEASTAGRSRARSTERLAGAGDSANRFGTAVAISRAVRPQGGVTDVYLARADDFPDALASGSLTDGPTLLVPSCGPLPTVVGEELQRLGALRVVALGGARAVCDGVLADAAQLSGTPDTGRLAGTTRLDTAVTIARFQFPDGAEEVALARADTFPDAMAASPFPGPVLLVPSCGDLPTSVARVIRELDPDRVVALGGQGAVCTRLLRLAASA
jgi:putative cell wall-binding protein